MKTEIKTPVLIVVGIVVLAGILYWGMKMVGSSGSLDQGQVKYTPGTPPWLEKDPSKRGPGSSGPGAHAPQGGPPPAGSSN